MGPLGINRTRYARPTWKPQLHRINNNSSNTTVRTNQSRQALEALFRLTAAEYNVRHRSRAKSAQKAVARHARSVARNARTTSHPFAPRNRRIYNTAHAFEPLRILRQARVQNILFHEPAKNKNTRRRPNPRNLARHRNVPRNLAQARAARSLIALAAGRQPSHAAPRRRYNAYSRP